MLFASLIFAAFLVFLCWIRPKLAKIAILVSIILSYILAGTDILATNPHQFAWLCNIICIFGVILFLRFSQRVFDIYVYFAIGTSTWPFFVSVGSYMPTHPLMVFAYWSKHALPAVSVIYFCWVEKRKLSFFSHYYAITFMHIYIAFAFFYNFVFDQNILELSKSSLPISSFFHIPGLFIVLVFMNTYLEAFVMRILAGLLGLIITSKDTPIPQALEE